MKIRLRELNEWLQLLAAIGVVVGLILVATEIRQNADLARAQLNSDTLAGLEQISVSRQNDTLARALAKAYQTPAKLTVEEGLIIDGFYRQIFDVLIRENTFVQRGIYQDQRDLAARIFAANVLNSEFGRIWWEESKGDFSSRLVAIVDEQVESMSPESVSERIQRIQERVLTDRER